MYKRLAFAFLFTFYMGSIAAQDRFFLDKDSRRLPDSTHAAYYIIPTIVSDSYYKIEVYYINGKLRMTGNSLYSDSVVANGYCVYYDKAGNKTGEGRYVGGKQKGLYIGYYKDTNVVHVKYETKDNGDYDLESYYLNGKLKRKQTKRNNQKATGTCYSQEGKEIDFTPYMQMPEPATPINQYLTAHTKYPGKARRRNIEGRVIIGFTIAVDGVVTDVHVVQAVNDMLDEEAIRVIQEMPAWRPSKEDDEPVKAYYTVPILFKLK